MKILIATPLYPPEIGGPATYTKEIAEKLKKDHEVTIVTYADNPKPIEGVSLYAISKKQFLPIRLFKYYKLIKKLSKEVDIIHSQNAVASGLTAVLAGKKTETPVVIRFVGDEAWERSTQAGVTNKKLDDWINSPENNLKSKIIMLIESFVFKKANTIMTPSKFLQDIIIKGYKINPNKVIVNYNAAKQPEEYTGVNFKEKKPHQILATARLTSWKGVDGIIKAVDIVRKRIPDIKLVVAGDGPEFENLKNLSKELGIENNVKFLGNVSKNETEALRKESTLYILNSTYEGLPHTVLTCFYIGIPVIATNIPGTNEVAIDNETAVLIEPNNPEMLAKTIEELIEDKEKQNRLVTNGYKLLKEKFSWNTHINNLLNISEKLIKQK